MKPVLALATLALAAAFAAHAMPGAGGGPAPAPHGGATAAAPVKKLPKAAGPEGRTVEEVVKGKSALKDKTVLVNAQVVKVTNDIMGKNWVHLQDGSGKAADATHDVIATTRDKVAVGDVVKARGTVRTDVNIGSGYSYAVLIEDAALKK
jgi:hypothetical protein